MNAIPASLHDHVAIVDTVRHVRNASNELLQARYRLDDAELACEALDDLSDDASTLLADWSGRPVTADFRSEACPAWIAKAAREWRRQNGRSY